MHKDGERVHERIGDVPGPMRTDGIGAAYEADDGPLSDGEVADLRRIAYSRLPMGEVVFHRILA